MRRYHLTIGGRTFEVEVVSLSGHQARVLVNGQPYEVNIEPPAGSPGRVSKPPPSPRPSPAPPPPRPVTAPTAPPPRPAPAPGLGAVTAPMPGLILEVLVQPGDRVRVGDTVVKLEAMKMENDIRAAADGVVSEVRVSKGANVAVGEVLVVVSPG